MSATKSKYDEVVGELEKRQGRAPSRKNTHSGKITFHNSRIVSVPTDI